MLVKNRSFVKHCLVSLLIHGDQTSLAIVKALEKTTFCAKEKRNKMKALVCRCREWLEDSRTRENVVIEKRTTSIVLTSIVT